MSHNDNKEELLRLRSEIDAIDNEIMALLKKRADVVIKVGALKARDKNSNGKCYIRSGREAKMLRRIYEQFATSKFSAQAATAIWRLIIAASTAVEGELKLSVYGTEQDNNTVGLAREYFGSFTPIIRQPVATRVIGDVLDGKAAVGILPMPNNEETTPWWPHLMQKGKDSPRIFATIPFVTEGKTSRAPTALAFAKLEPEDTGDDITLLVIETDENTSTNRLSTAFSKAKIETNWLSIHSPSPALRHHLIAAKGFYADGNEALAKIKAELQDAVTNITILGAYATPIMISQKKNHEESSKSDTKPSAVSNA